MGKKDNTILMVGVGILAGYLLMPEKLKEKIPGIGDGGGQTSVNLSDLLGGINLPGGIPGTETIVKVITEAGGKAEEAIETVTEVVEGGKDIIDTVTDPVKAITDPLKEVLDGLLDAIERGIPDGSSDPTKPSNPGTTKDTGGKTERDIGGKWENFVAGWQNRQTYPTFFGKTLLDHLTSWFAPTGYAEVTPYAESVMTGGKSESPGDSDISHPSYLAERGSRESSPTRETPVNEAVSDRRYRSYSTKTKTYTTRDLSSAMRYGGGT